MIDLCIMAFHSKDVKRVERSAEDIVQMCNFYFDQMDANQDGFDLYSTIINGLEFVVKSFK